MIFYEKGILSRNKIKDYVYMKNGVCYNNHIYTVDIETSSGYYDGKNVLPYKKGQQKEYSKYVKVSLCYLWQAGINDVIYYGRELETFLDYLYELLDIYDGKIIMWCHNFSFEFQFFQNIMKFEKIFARTERKVIYSEFDRLTIRCSYFLTRKSLANWAYDEKLPVQKLKEYDYTKIRTPLTPLNDFELTYGEYDCLVMYHGIKKYRERYKTVHAIPLTQTGEVRRVVKEKLKSYQYHQKITSLLPKNAYEYARLKAAFAGGWTHANYFYAGDVITSVNGKDIVSSYPAVMLAYKYPMSRFEKVEEYEMFSDSDKYSLIIDITFYHIRSIKCNDYISVSKCYYVKNEVTDNGRIICADEIRMIITNIDYDIIKMMYTFKSVKYNDIRCAINKYLPKPFLEYLLELYSDKTTLKDIEEFAGKYVTSKQFINSMFGMTCTAIIQEDVIYNNGKWDTDKLTPSRINEKLDDLREKPYKNFLYYAWGVFVTAYARLSLFKVISQIDSDVIYCDTDSIKYIGNHDDIFEKYNAEITEKLKATMRFFEFDSALLHPRDKHGIPHPLGVYENDKGVPYQEFKTLGAKRYCYRDCNGDLKMTVSGISKEVGVKALNNDINNFADDFVFSEEYANKLILTYLDDMPTVTWQKGKPDEYVSKYSYGIHAEPTTYTLNVSGEYMFLMETDLDIKENLDMDAKSLHDLILKEGELCRRNKKEKKK